MSLAFAGKEAKPTKPAEEKKVEAKAEKVTKRLTEGRKGTIVEASEAKAQVVIDSEGVKVTAHVAADTVLMKDGEKASLRDFKAGDAVVFGFKPRSNTELRFLADELSFVAFIRRETVKGEVISFSSDKGELKLKTEKGEGTIQLTKVTRYFLGGKQLKGADVQLKPGDKVYVGYSTTGMAYVVFDKDSWKIYAQMELQKMQKKLERKRLEGAAPKEKKKPAAVSKGKE